MKNKEMPTMLFLVGLGLLLFFIYAALVIGMNLHTTLAANRSTVSLFVNSCLQFVSDNRLILAVAAAILIVVRLFVRSPRAARF